MADFQVDRRLESRREVEKVHQILGSHGTKMLEVKNVEMIRVTGRRFPDREIASKTREEMKEGMVANIGKCLRAKVQCLFARARLVNRRTTVSELCTEGTGNLV